jgi:hypothetical protein
MIAIPDISPETFQNLVGKLRQTAEVTEESGVSGETYTVKGDFEGHHIEATFIHWDDPRAEYYRHQEAVDGHRGDD